MRLGGRLRFAAGTAGGGGGVLLRGFFVFIAAIVGYVEAAAFENQTGAAADATLYLAFAPLFQAAKVFRAGRQWVGRNGLELFKLVSALFADVIICWHIWLLS